MASPHIRNAQIYTSGQQFFAGYWRDHQAGAVPFPTIPVGQAQVRWFRGGQIALIHSIIFQGKLVGFVYLVSDLNEVKDRLRSYLLIAAAVLLLSLIAAMGVSGISQKVISEPVVQLAQLVRAVAGNQDYSVRMPAPANQDEVAILVEAFNDMLTQIEARDRALLQVHNELEQRVQDRTAQLAAANKELEAFSYSVAHDLRAPLRSIDGFSQAVLEDYADKLDAEGVHQLQRVRAASQRMSVLIDDLLNLARITRSEVQKRNLNLSSLAESVAAEFKKNDPERSVEFVIEENLFAEADPQLLRIVFENLLGNAWKYTSRHVHARIEFGKSQQDTRLPYFVRDDGAGFDPRHAARLFGAFQRLHSTSEFPGTGIGLATVQRIVQKHGGVIWAEAALEKGATFFFTL
jgi:signal transduction histidine kinase